ncbi:MAG: hypothetical protein IPF82_17085 [Blastocatellia bacterium]|nr:hypothetical protein [Blastocatellia bacterium]
MNPREFAREGDYPTAILLTYSFDPLFFERICLPDLWTGGTGDTLVVADAAEATRAIRGREGQCLRLGRSYQMALAKSAGAFHPKVMLRLGRDGGLVWVGSGNLTCGGWGANRELAGAWRIGPKEADTGSWVGGFLDGVARCLHPNRQFDVLGRAKAIDWVAATSDAAGREFGPILATFDGRSLSARLAERWAGRRFEEVRILTGSTDENAAFVRWAHAEFGISRATILVPGSSSSLLAGELGRCPVEVRVLGVPSPSLHAKFYWFAGPDGDAAVTGSANCSAQAWLRPPGPAEMSKRLSCTTLPTGTHSPKFSPSSMTRSSNPPGLRPGNGRPRVSRPVVTTAIGCPRSAGRPPRARYVRRSRTRLGPVPANCNSKVRLTVSGSFHRKPTRTTGTANRVMSSMTAELSSA